MIRSSFHFLFTLSLLLTLSSCLLSSESTSSSSSSSSSEGQSQGGDTGGPSGGGSGGPTGSTCYGTEQDGHDDAQADELPKVPLYNYDINLAGRGKSHSGPNWTPGLTGYDPNIPSVQEALAIFNTDSRLKVRLKVKEWNLDCVGRDVNPYINIPYSKIKFDLNIRPVDGSGNLGAPIHTVGGIGPVNLDSCSPIIELPIPVTNNGFVVEIANVKSDSYCEYAKEQEDPETREYLESLYCPVKERVAPQVCWKGVLQISTDLTHDFK